MLNEKKSTRARSTPNRLVTRMYTRARILTFPLDLGSIEAAPRKDDKLSRIVRKRTFWYVRTMKTQISLRIQSDYSLRCPHEDTVSLAIQNVPREDSDQPARSESSLGAHVRRYIYCCCGFNYSLSKMIFKKTQIFNCVQFSGGYLFYFDVSLMRRITFRRPSIFL